MMFIFGYIGLKEKIMDAISPEGEIYTIEMYLCNFLLLFYLEIIHQTLLFIQKYSLFKYKSCTRSPL